MSNLIECRCVKGWIPSKCTDRMCMGYGWRYECEHAGELGRFPCRSRKCYWGRVNLKESQAATAMDRLLDGLEEKAEGTG